MSSFAGLRRQPRRRASESGSCRERRPRQAHRASRVTIELPVATTLLASARYSASASVNERRKSLGEALMCSHARREAHRILYSGAVRCAAAMILAGCFTRPDPPRGVADDSRSADATLGGIRLLGESSIAVLGSGAEVALAPPPPLATTLVVAVGVYPGTTTTVADTAGNVYTKVSAVATPAGAWLTMFYSTNVITADPFMVYATAPSATEVTLAVHVYADVAGFGGSSAQSGTSATPSSGPVSVTVAGALAFGAVSHDTDVTTSPGANYMVRTVATENSSMVPLVTEDRMIEPGSGPVTATFGLSSSSGWGCGLMMFNPEP